MAKEYPVTRINVQVVKKDGSSEELKNLSEGSKSTQETLDAIVKEGGAHEVIKAQTFTFHEATDLQDALALCDGNEAVAVDFFNRGYSIEENRIAREFMKGDEAAQEGAYDLRPEAIQPAERRKADPMSKAAKALSQLGINITPDQLATLLQAQFAPQAAAPSGD